MDGDQYLKSLIDKVLVISYLQDVKVELSEGSNNGDNYMGEITRMTVTRGEETKSFIIKIVNSDPKYRENVNLNRVYMREIICYEKIFPEYDKFQQELNLPCFNHAKCVFTRSDMFYETVIMEDLGLLGYKTLERTDKFDWEMLKIIFKTMADFHALSFAMKEKKPEVYQEIMEDIKPIGYIGDQFFEMIMEVVKQAKEFVVEENTENFEKFLHPLRENVLDCFEHTTSDPYNVLVQGDSWIKNLIFRYQGNKPIDLIILDWQFCKITSPVFDLFVVLFVNATSATRRLYFKKCFDLYYESLSSRLAEMDCDVVKLYPRHIFEEQMKKFSVYGISIGIMMSIFIYSEGAVEIIGLDKGAKAPFGPESIQHLNEVINDAIFLGLM